jgi:hypothetical protein
VAVLLLLTWTGLWFSVTAVLLIAAGGLDMRSAIVALPHGGLTKKESVR